MFTSIGLFLISTFAATVIAQGGRGGGNGPRPWGGNDDPDRVRSDPFNIDLNHSPSNTDPMDIPFNDHLQTRCPTVYTTATDLVCSTCAEPDCTIITTVAPDCACGTVVPTVTVEYPCEGRCPGCELSYIFPTATADCW